MSPAILETLLLKQGTEKLLSQVRDEYSLPNPGKIHEPHTQEVWWPTNNLERTARRNTETVAQTTNKNKGVK